VAPDDTLHRLERALQAHRRALQELEDALLAELNTRSRDGDELLSIQDVCQELGMGKSWVYHRLRSGEIPSIKLGRNIKVKREDLEQYLRAQRFQPGEG
jgi:excisionase family DNA binding protein